MIKNTLPPTDLKTKDFYYDLPESLIAQIPTEPRDMSRLMAINKTTGEIEHKIFRDIVDYLNENDILVINDSKVIPARLYGIKDGTETAVEVLLLRQRSSDTWESIVKPGRRLRKGVKITFGDGMLSAVITDITDDGNRYLQFDLSGSDLYNMLEQIGNVPLPPYIKADNSFKDRYQTVYAKESGSAAAPTAGLHFTNELLDKIKSKGVKIVRVMLHVGLGTFRPVKADKLNDHVMHSEYFELSRESADIINNRKGRIIAVGTTSCRVLESVSDDTGYVKPFCGDTGIFIYPGYKFKIVDALITNFHLPESSLLMLISAFASKDIIFKAYDEAISKKYRFFSFGDATLIF